MPPSRRASACATSTAIAAAAGGELAEALRVTVYTTRLEEFPAINEAYAEFFGEPPPARVTIGVAALPKGALVEIDAIVPPGRERDPARTHRRPATTPAPRPGPAPRRCRRCRRAPGPSRPRASSPSALTWAETVAGGGYASKVLARGTTLRLTDLAGRRLRPPPPLQRRPALGAAQRRRHREGALAGLPRRRPPAALRPGPGAGHDRRRQLRPPRRALRDHDPGRQRGSATATARRRAPPPPAASCSCWPPPSTGSARATSRPASPSSRACGSTARAALRFEGSAGAGAAVELRIELPVIVIVANVPHPLDPRADYTATTLEVLAWRGDADRARATRSGPRPRSSNAPSSTPPTTPTRGGSR